MDLHALLIFALVTIKNLDENDVSWITIVPLERLNGTFSWVRGRRPDGLGEFLFNSLLLIKGMMLCQIKARLFDLLNSWEHVQLGRNLLGLSQPLSHHASVCPGISPKLLLLLAAVPWALERPLSFLWWCITFPGLVPIQQTQGSPWKKRWRARLTSLP